MSRVNEHYIFIRLARCVCNAYLATSIKLKEFDQSSDVALFAKEIIENCKYIHPGKQAFIEDLLRQLQVRLIWRIQHALYRYDVQKLSRLTYSCDFDGRLRLQARIAGASHQAQVEVQQQQAVEGILFQPLLLSSACVCMT